MADELQQIRNLGEEIKKISADALKTIQKSKKSTEDYASSWVEVQKNIESSINPIQNVDKQLAGIKERIVRANLAQETWFNAAQRTESVIKELQERKQYIIKLDEELRELTLKQQKIEQESKELENLQKIKTQQEEQIANVQKLDELQKRQKISSAGILQTEINRISELQKNKDLQESIKNQQDKVKDIEKAKTELTKLQLSQNGQLTSDQRELLGEIERRSVQEQATLKLMEAQQTIKGFGVAHEKELLDLLEKQKNASQALSVEEQAELLVLQQKIAQNNGIILTKDQEIRLAELQKKGEQELTDLEKERKEVLEKTNIDRQLQLSLIDEEITSANKSLEIQNRKIEKYQQYINQGKKIEESLSIQKTRLEAIADIFKKILDLNNLLTKAYDEYDKLIAKNATTQGILRKQSVEQFDIINKTVTSSKNLTVTTEQTLEAVQEINKSFGVLAGEYMPEAAMRVTELSNAIGISKADSAKFFENLAQIGNSSFQSQQNMAGFAKAAADAAKVPLGTVINDVVRAGSNLRLIFKGTTEELIKQTAELRRLGSSLDSAAKSAESLLNFESSIGAELKLSALLGQSINFNEARRLFFSGKVKEGEQAIIQQLEKIGDLDKLNYFQRKALVEATGKDFETLQKMASQKKTLAQIDSENPELAKERQKYEKELEKLQGNSIEQKKRANELAALENVAKARSAVLDEQKRQTAIAIGKALAPVKELFYTIQIIVYKTVAVLSSWAGPIVLVVGAITALIAAFGTVYLSILSIKKGIGLLSEGWKLFTSDGIKGVKDLFSKTKEGLQEAADKTKELDKLKNAQEAAGKSSSGMTGFSRGLSRLGVGARNLGMGLKTLAPELLKTAVAFAIFAAGIIGIAYAFTLIKDVPIKQMLTFGAIIVALTFTLSKAGKSISDNKANLLGMVGLTAVIIGLAYAMSLLKDVNIAQIISFGGVVTALSLVISNAGKSISSNKSAFIGMAALSAAIIGMAYAVSLLKDVSTKQIMTFGIVVGVLAGTIALVGKSISDNKGAFIGMAALSTSVIAMAYAMSLIKNVPAAQIITFGVVSGILAGALAKVGKTISENKGSLSGIVGVSLGIAGMAAAFSLLKNVSVENMIAFSIGVGILAVALGTIGKSISNNMASLGAIAVVSLSIMGMAFAFSLIEKISVGKMITFAVTVGLLSAALVALGYAAGNPVAIAGIAVITLAVLGMGAAMLMAGTGVKLLGHGIKLAAEGFQIFGKAVESAFKIFIEHINKLPGALTSLAISLTKIGLMAPLIGLAAGTIGLLTVSLATLGLSLIIFPVNNFYKIALSISMIGSSIKGLSESVTTLSNSLSVVKDLGNVLKGFSSVDISTYIEKLTSSLNDLSSIASVKLPTVEIDKETLANLYFFNSKIESIRNSFKAFSTLPPISFKINGLDKGIVENIDLIVIGFKKLSSSLTSLGFATVNPLLIFGMNTLQKNTKTISDSFKSTESSVSIVSTNIKNITTALKGLSEIKPININIDAKSLTNDLLIKIEKLNNSLKNTSLTVDALKNLPNIKIPEFNLDKSVESLNKLKDIFNVGFTGIVGDVKEKVNIVISLIKNISTTKIPTINVEIKGLDDSLINKLKSLGELSLNIKLFSESFKLISSIRLLPIEFNVKGLTDDLINKIKTFGSESEKITSFVNTLKTLSSITIPKLDFNISGLTDDLINKIKQFASEDNRIKILTDTLKTLSVITIPKLDFNISGLTDDLINKIKQFGLSTKDVQTVVNSLSNLSKITIPSFEFNIKGLTDDFTDKIDKTVKGISLITDSVKSLSNVLASFPVVQLKEMFEKIVLFGQSGLNIKNSSDIVRELSTINLSNLNINLKGVDVQLTSQFQSLEESSEKIKTNMGSLKELANIQLPKLDIDSKSLDALSKYNETKEKQTTDLKSGLDIIAQKIDKLTELMSNGGISINIDGQKVNHAFDTARSVRGTYGQTLIS